MTFNQLTETRAGYPYAGHCPLPDDYTDPEFKVRYNTCAECGSDELVLLNYDMMWHDGDLICKNGHYVRGWDAG